MNIVIPMAGMGKRLRPHTLTTPKPLVPIAGKPIVQRLVEDIAEVCTEKIENIGFITGRFGQEAEDHLLSVAESLGAKGHIFYQDEPLGTAHAILCAEPLLRNKTIVAFADTLFQADFKWNDDVDGILWTKQIDDPSAFGVVKLDEQGAIIDYVEKPKEWVSDLAMIGIYYFKDGQWLSDELQYLIDNNVIKGGEYQLPDALRNMTNKGAKFVPGTVDQWLDCGNKKVTVLTNQAVLDMKASKEQLVDPTASIEDSIVIAPCYIGPNVTIKNSVVGPHVSIGENSNVENSIVKNSIIQTNTQLHNCNFKDSMIGNHVNVNQSPNNSSIGDYTEIS